MEGFHKISLKLEKSHKIYMQNVAFGGDLNPRRFFHFFVEFFCNDGAWNFNPHGVALHKSMTLSWRAKTTQNWTCKISPPYFVSCKCLGIYSECFFELFVCFSFNLVSRFYYDNLGPLCCCELLSGRQQ